MGLGLTNGVLVALVDFLGIDYRPAKYAAAALVFQFNFGCRKRFLFKACGNPGAACSSGTL